MMTRSNASFSPGNSTQVVVLALCQRAECLAWMRLALDSMAIVLPVGKRADDIVQAVGKSGASLLIADFGDDHPETALFEQLRLSFPDLKIIGVGSLSDQQALLAAMRAQVVDYVEQESPIATLRNAAERILAEIRQRRQRTGRLITLCGGIGAGCTTIACNMATLLKVQRPDASVLLLDFATPVGDAAIHLGVAPHICFAEAVRNLDRCDRTYLNTAIARTPGGIGVLPLFHEVNNLRGLKLADAFQLLVLILSTYDLVIADLGGAAFSDLGQYLQQTADEILLVTDQSVGNILESKKIAANLREKLGNRLHVHLVVNHYEPILGVESADIADELGLPLLENAVLPERRVPLMQSMNQGKTLVEALPKDALVHIFGLMTGQLLAKLWPDQAALTSRPTHSRISQWWHAWRKTR